MTHPTDLGPEIRPAATVVVLRDGEAGLEVLLLRRAQTLAFYGGAWVFPGGRIDAEDGLAELGLLEAARRAAARELYEEAGLRVRSEDLLGFARWLTPPGGTRRFDTFYFAVAADQTEVRVDASESDAFAWRTPPAAIAAHKRGEIELPPPTFVTLCQLTAADSVGAALRMLGSHSVHFEPHPTVVEGGLVYLYAGDAGYDTRDPEVPGARHRLWVMADDIRYDCSAGSSGGACDETE